MKLSTRGRYGTRAMLDLALCGTDKLVPLKEIAQRQQLSLRYLENLIAPLVTAGLIRSIRGNKGGISLAKPPGEIRLSDVIQALEGPIVLVECCDNPGCCERSSFCATRDLWGKMESGIKNILENTTLQDLIDRKRKKEQSPQLAC
jgi:Rrf2 family transcriptional regulator, cysteine metabolism repressor